MKAALSECIQAAIDGFAREAAWWSPPPVACRESRDRLQKFILLDAPANIIQLEIDLLNRKTALMRRTRLNAYH